MAVIQTWEQQFFAWISQCSRHSSGHQFLSKYIFLFQERTGTVKVRVLRLARSHQWDKWLYLGSLMTPNLSQAGTADGMMDRLICSGDLVSHVRGAIMYSSF